MSNHNTLFYNLMQFIGNSGIRFHDLRIMTTFVWSVLGLIMSESTNLPDWSLYLPEATKAASKERKLSRWLHNEKIRPMLVFQSLAKQVLAEWAGQKIYVALDTTMLWQKFVVVRLALVYRGRAIPLGWVVCASGSATVGVARYQRMLAQVAALMPTDSHVILLADRGFMDTKLMKLARDLGWHFRIRVKLNIKIHRATKGKTTVRTLMPPVGQARFFNYVWLTEHRFGPVHLAVSFVHTKNGTEKWAIVSDELADLTTFDEYALRFDIEENFLDDKSAGFQLESSQLRDSMALSRLCLIMATATIYLVSTGTAIVEMGKRPLVDTHWRRGISYFKIGWRWVKLALQRGDRLLSSLWLSSAPDAEPAIACWKQHEKPEFIHRIKWL